jgi:tetratricopeptide (TPR) repeat protein
MARKSHPRAADTLEDIQDAADRLGRWIQDNLLLVVTGVGALLVAVAAGSFFAASQRGAEEEASLALTRVRVAYLNAMGAPPGALEVPELASEAAAERIRNEYIERFAAVADEHTGTVSGAIARLEVGNLVRETDPPAAVAIWEQTLAEAPSNPALRGLVLQRIAQAQEEAGHWQEAAETHARAAALDGFPLRHWALADAARCYGQAGDPERALALYEQVETQAPDLRLPDHQRAELRELRALASAAN